MLKFADDTPERYDFRLLIGHFLDAALQTAGEEQIVYRDLKSFTYRQFRARIGKLASLLQDRGVTQGTTVAMLDWDSHRYLESYFAVPMMGAVLHTVNVRVPKEDIFYSLRASGAEIALINSDFNELTAEIRANCHQIKEIIAISDDPVRPLRNDACGEYEDLLEGFPDTFAFEEFDENALATTFFTSGTTGRPKQVSFSHRQIVLLALSLSGYGATRHRAFGRDDVYMPLTPMFHVHAWCFPYVATMLGTKQIYPGRYEPAMICQLRREHRVTFSHCVPTVLRMLIDGARDSGTDLADWAVVTGGAPLSIALFEEARSMGMHVAGGFGMSETGPVTTLARRPRRAEAGLPGESTDLTKAGTPISLVSLEIFDKDLRPLPHDGVTRGELVIRSPWVTSGYVGDREASEALWRGGWLHTQDIATIDPSGQVTIRDREKDIIKTGGEWISSVELESLISTIDGVHEVAVIGVYDARWGERPLAAVVLQEGELTLEAINAPIRHAIGQQKLSRYALVDRVEFLDALPRTGVGKIDKKVLRAAYSQSTPDAELRA